MKHELPKSTPESIAANIRWKLIREFGLASDATVTANIENKKILSVTIQEKGVGTIIPLYSDGVKKDEIKEYTLSDQPGVQNTVSKMHSHHIQIAIDCFGTSAT